MRSIDFSFGKAMRLGLAAALPLSAVSAHALTFSASGLDGSHVLAAQADFSVSGTLLTVVLTNTAPAAADNPGRTLSSLFFTVEGSPSIGAQSVSLDGSTTINAEAGFDLAKKWGFKSGINFTGGTLDLTDSYGLSSVGLGIFGKANQFNPSYSGGSQLNGDDYNLVPMAGIGSSPSMTGGSKRWIKDHLKFTLNVPAGFDVNDIHDVQFHYGSGTEFTTLQAVPEPASMAALAIGGLGLIRRRRAAR